MSQFEIKIGPDSKMRSDGSVKKLPSEAPGRSPGMFAFIGSLPFDVTPADDVIVHDVFGIFHATADRVAIAGEYVELVVDGTVGYPDAPP
jgi:hypothetical protein